MLENLRKCSKNVGNNLTCRSCGGSVIKYGKSQVGKTRYRCKSCLKTMLQYYTYRACEKETNSKIIVLIKEGCGIRSTARILQISSTTLLDRILHIARHIKRPFPIFEGKSYEVDEMFTYVKHKDNRICIAYSFEVGSGNVIDFVVGRRNKTTLRKVTDTLVLSDASK